MTNEEADLLAMVKGYKEALDMAIKALKQQPCEDCISRQAAFDVIDEAFEIIQPIDEDADKIGDCIAQLIDKLPSVTSVRPK